MAVPTHDTPPFKGWPADAKPWFEGLIADNSRAYFQRSRATYDRTVRQPFESLLAEVEDEFGEGKVFRQNRDTRFSADKSPYKTQTAAAINRPEGGAYYAQVSVEGLFVGAAYYHFMRDQLDRYRKAVDADDSGSTLEGVVAGLRTAGYQLGAGEALATAPKGYDRDHPRVELLRHKGIYSVQSWPWHKWVSTAAAKDRITGVWRDARPLLDWLDRHVGPTTMPTPSR